MIEVLDVGLVLLNRLSSRRMLKVGVGGTVVECGMLAELEGRRLIMIVLEQRVRGELDACRQK